MRRRAYPIVAATAVLLAACGSTNNEPVNDCTTEISDDVTEPATWGEECPTVLVTESVDVSSELTIAEGTTVLMEQDVLLDVDGEGSLTAVGAEGAPIVFEGVSGDKGYWSGIAIETASDKNAMRWVTIRDAGGEGFKFNPWTLTVAGTSTSSGTLRIQQTTIENSSGVGLVIREGGQLVDSADMTFRDIDMAPIEVAFPAAGQLHPSFVYESLPEPYIRVTKGTIRKDILMDWSEVPYRMEDDLTIKAGAGFYAGPGTTFEFEQDAKLETNGGVISLRGSEEEPIIVRGAQEVPGFWGGLVFESVDTENYIENAVIEYAGAKGWKGHEAAVIVAGDSTNRGSVTIEDTLFREINGDGVKIFKGGVAEMSGNEFEAVTGGEINDLNESSD